MRLGQRGVAESLPPPRSTSTSPDSIPPDDAEDGDEVDIPVADVKTRCRGLLWLPFGRLTKGAAVVEVGAAAKEDAVGGRRRFRCTPAPAEEEEEEEDDDDDEVASNRLRNVAGVRTLGVAARRGARIESDRFYITVPSKVQYSIDNII